MQDQVIVFRLLPLITSATVVEYLNTRAREVLLKAMGQADGGRDRGSLSTSAQLSSFYEALCFNRE
jgi:hypothetical protein